MHSSQMMSYVTRYQKSVQSFQIQVVVKLSSHLKNLGPIILLQRDSWQKLLSEVGFVVNTCRWSQAIHYRAHHVASPNTIWHKY